MTTLCIYRDKDNEVVVYTDAELPDGTRVIYITEEGGYGDAGETVQREPGFVKFDDLCAPRCTPYHYISPIHYSRVMDAVQAALVADRLTGYTP